MVVISVDVPERIANNISSNSNISINDLYDLDDESNNWNSVKVGEKSSTVLNYLKNIR